MCVGVFALDSWELLSRVAADVKSFVYQDE